jgi:hypothetical protein
MAYQYVEFLHPYRLSLKIEFQYLSDYFKFDSEIILSVSGQSEKFRFKRLLEFFNYLYESYPSILMHIRRMQDYKGTLQIETDPLFSENYANKISVKWQEICNENHVEILCRKLKTS